MYSSNSFKDKIIFYGGCFTTLQDESPETEGIPFTTTFQNIFPCQLITENRLISFPYTAIIAIVTAMVGNLDQPTNKYPIAKLLK